jgi:hypothetical protein
MTWRSYILLAVILQFLAIAVAIGVFRENPVLQKVLIGGSAVMLIGVFFWLDFLRLPRMRRELFGRRPELPDEVLFAKHYESTGIPGGLVAALRNDIAEAFGVPLHNIYPSDRFDTEFVGERGAYCLGGADDDLAEAAVRSAARVGHDVDLSGVETVDDYIRAFGSIRCSN